MSEDLSRTWLDTILECAGTLEGWIPGAGNSFRDLLIGVWPEADQVVLYGLAERYGAAADELAAAYVDVEHGADAILLNWEGGLAAWQFRDQWFSYLQVMQGAVGGLQELQFGVQSLALQVELMKWMVALNLVLLLVTLIVLIIKAFFTFGGSLVGVPVAFLRTKTTNWTVKETVKKAIRGIPMLGRGIRDLAVRTVRAAPRLARVGPGRRGPRVPARRGPRRGWRPRGGWGAAGRRAGNRLWTPARATGRRWAAAAGRGAAAGWGGVRQGAAAAGRAAGRGAAAGWGGVRQGAAAGWGAARGLPGSLARGLLPRNVIARTLAAREARRHLRALGKAGVRLPRRQRAAAFNLVARQVELQLLERWGAKAGVSAAQRALARATARASRNPATQRALGELGLEVSAKALNARVSAHVAKYVAGRAAAGGVFMGGGNFLGQSMQKLAGRRESYDWGQVGLYSGMGAMFGAGMWGGVTGSTLGTGVAGGLFAAMTGDNVWEGALHGAMVGGVFGPLNNMHLSKWHAPLKQGQKIGVSPAGKLQLTSTRTTFWRGAEVTKTVTQESGGAVSWQKTRTDGGARIGGETQKVTKQGLVSPDGKQVLRETKTEVTQREGDQPRVTSRERELFNDDGKVVGRETTAADGSTVRQELDPRGWVPGSRVRVSEQFDPAGNLVSREYLDQAGRSMGVERFDTGRAGLGDRAVVDGTVIDQAPPGGGGPPGGGATPGGGPPAARPHGPGTGEPGQLAGGPSRPQLADRPGVPEPGGPAQPAGGQGGLPGRLSGLEQTGPDRVPVVRSEQVNLPDPVPAGPLARQEVTPAMVAQALADPNTPAPVRQWIQDHLAVQDSSGRYVPKSPAEIQAAMSRLAQESMAAVRGAEPDPRAGAPARSQPDTGGAPLRTPDAVSGSRGEVAGRGGPEAAAGREGGQPPARVGDEGGQPPARVGDEGAWPGEAGGGTEPPPKPTAEQVLRDAGRLHVEDAAAAAPHLQDMAGVHPAAARVVAQQADVHIGSGTVTSIGPGVELAGKQPRGWPPGKTWDQVPGAYLPDKQAVVVGTGGHGSTSLFLHEFGHALDHAAGRALDPAGRPLSDSAPFKQLARDYPPAKDNYYSQPGQAGRQELWAELWAAWTKTGGGEAPAWRDAMTTVGIERAKRAEAAQAFDAYFRNLTRQLDALPDGSHGGAGTGPGTASGQSVVGRAQVPRPNGVAPIRAPDQMPDGPAARTGAGDGPDPSPAVPPREPTPDDGIGPSRHGSDAPAHDLDAPLTPDTIEQKYGIPKRNQANFQRYTDGEGLIVEVRPTNPDSVSHLEAGAMPKPREIKSKTINEYDLMLNPRLSQNDKGLAALFEPQLPDREQARLPGRDAPLTDRQWDALQDRFDARKREWDKYHETIGVGGQEGRFRVVENGTIEGRDANGDWRPVTGDHDLWDIRKADGSRLDPATHERIIDRMRKDNMGVQHDTMMNWPDLKPGYETKQIFEPIVRQHQPGGEPLLHFSPGEPPRLVWADPPVEPLGNLGGAGTRDPNPGSPSRDYPSPGLPAPPERAAGPGGPDAPGPARSQSDGGPTQPDMAAVMRGEVPGQARHDSAPAPTESGLPPRSMEGMGYERTLSGADVERASGELRGYFPREWVQVDGHVVRIITEDGSTVRVRAELGDSTGVRVDPRTGEHVVTLSRELAPREVLRELVEQVAGVVAAETGGRPGSGAFKRLDVLANERAWTQHRLDRNPDAPTAQRGAWEAELARLTHEFRDLAEQLGLLSSERRHDPDHRVLPRRDEAWAELSDGSRSLLVDMTDAAGTTGRSGKARSYLPLTAEFRKAYESLDSFAHYLETKAPTWVRQQFEAGLLTGIREFQADVIARFKATYREVFPSTSLERPLTAERAAAAKEQVAPLVEDVRARLEATRSWAEATGVPELRRDTFDQAVEAGAQVWRERYDQTRATIDEVVARFTYAGEPLGYIGSMQDGVRGPHKGLTRADLNAFDVDLYVVHPSEFDRLYDTVKASSPESVSRGKIFPAAEHTPELVRLTKKLQRALRQRFPHNSDVADSEVVLRRDPPY